MALVKKITYDYEVRGPWKCIQQRIRTAVEEDGVEISKSFHRNSFMPDADVSGESDEVKALASALWTSAVSASWSDHQTSSSLGL
tara:strand:+ start:338 stop:592 length:255 start_codon:yes stop_codon:yes gene_type:complete